MALTVCFKLTVFLH